MPRERLQKVLSSRGVASRRQAEAWIEAGRVRVNGVVVAELGLKVDGERDRIEVNGVPVPPQRRPVVVLLNKPAGYVSTVRDPHAERTVMDLVSGLDRRVYPVGRLDRETRGVLLLTDDGELAHWLLHPRHAVEKVYDVTVAGNLPPLAVSRLASGVELEDGATGPVRVWRVRREAGRTRFRIALHQGRKRQVRRMVRAVEGRVLDLVRVSFGGITARGVPEGSWRFLSAAEVARLRRGGGATATGKAAARRRGPKRGGHSRRTRARR